MAVLALILLLPSVYAITRLAEVRAIILDLEGRQKDAGDALTRSRIELRELDRFARSYIVSGDASSRAAMRESIERTGTALEELRRTGYSAESRRFAAELQAIRRGTRRIEALVRAGRSDEAVAAFQDFKSLLDSAQASLEPVAAAIDRRSESAVARAEETALTARRTVWIAALGFVLVAALVGLWIARAHVGPVEEPRDATVPVADGERATLDVSDLLFTASRPFTALARQKEIRFAVELAPTAPESVRADIDRLQGDVLGNLLSNAFHFTGSGGQITLRARGDTRGLRIEVEDTGQGIPASRLATLFGDGPANGAGPGLAIARDAVEARGGEIGVVSDLGIGSTFWFTIPLEAPPVAVQRAV